MGFALDWQSPYVVIALGTFVVHEVAFLLFNLPYLYFDDNKVFQQYKVHPLSESKVTSDQRWGAFRMLFKEHFMILLPILLVATPVLQWIGFTTSASAWPSLQQFAFQFVVFNVLEDTGFYWIHRLLHTQWLYQNVHKRHHEFTEPFSLTGEISHPVEFVLNILLPLTIGPLIIAYTQGLHIVTFWIWICFRGLRGTDAHSGYNLSFHPLRLLNPIYGGPVGHDFHHMLRGRQSNFGGYRFWDWFCGTDASFKRYLAEKKAAAAVKSQ